mmetsp:Transcript_134413/g.268262  ORF Transcript_134413/g.268262 Transcript_134413/m.268262 type:complete len:108 (+) Transcript_134413:123-446(+)
MEGHATATSEELKDHISPWLPQPSDDHAATRHELGLRNDVHKLRRLLSGGRIFNLDKSRSNTHFGQNVPSTVAVAPLKQVLRHQGGTVRRRSTNMKAVLHALHRLFR